ncbi:MAG TPA: polysaccharide pyruvyl transferase family protein [Vicinamibacterales bacterium]
MTGVRFRARGSPRRVLVHTGTTDLCNAGDAAMLQRAVARLRSLWPDAVLAVITGRPPALARLCPGVQSVSADAIREWAADRFLFGHLETRIPSPARAPLTSMERALRRHWPHGATRLACARWRLGGHDPAPLRTGLAAIARADLLFVCGQGTLADAAPSRANGLLGLMEGAHALGVPTVMVGQGIGPIDDPALRTRTGRVLRHAAFIGLREGRFGPTLLTTLGVDAARTLVTGDDAVELAWAARPAMPGDGIGVNVRIASNAGTDTSVLAHLRPVLAALARHRAAPLVPLPISNHAGGTSDPATIRALLRGVDETTGGDELDTPAAVIAQAARCRVVITGAYHAAVFALSQGIPTVCIGRSRYVLDKMDGLAELFGDGCRVVPLAGRDSADAVGRAADLLWDQAPRLRPVLLAAAANQVTRARTAYARIAERFGDDARSSGRPATVHAAVEAR